MIEKYLPEICVAGALILILWAWLAVEFKTAWPHPEYREDKLPKIKKTPNGIEYIICPNCSNYLDPSAYKGHLEKYCTKN